jgi:hypothetical protein
MTNQKGKARNAAAANRTTPVDSDAWSSELLKILEEQAAAAANRLDRDDYERAAEALRRWQKSGGDLPGIVKQYRHLLPGADGLPAANDLSDRLLVASWSEIDAAPDTSSQLEAKVLVEPGQADERLVARDLTALHELDAREGELETPQQKTAREGLANMRQLLDKGLAGDNVALKQVVYMAQHLLQDSKAAAEAQRLQAQAQERLNQLVAEAVKQGDEAKQSGDLEAAHGFFVQAQELDKDNSEVLHRLADLRRQLASELSESEIRRLRLGLQNRRNLEELEKAVYEAEMLQLEERLTGDLLSLLQEARNYYDQARQSMGKQTTMMRFGDLRARQQARDAIEDSLIDRQEKIWDPTTDTFRPPSEVLEEAEIRWREASEDTAQYELSRIERALPEHPRWAQQRLLRVLAVETDQETGEPIVDSRRNEPRYVNPFFTEHRRLLEQKQEEIERLIQRQEEAESLIQQANENKEESFRLLLRAFGVFPYAAGLREQLQQAQQTAINLLLRETKSQQFQASQVLEAKKNVRPEDYDAARVFLNLADEAESQAQNLHENYESAYNSLLKENRIPANWLDEERWRQVASDLSALTKVSGRIRQEIGGQQRLFREFEGYARRIREQLKDPDSRTVAIKQFDKHIESNRQFHIFEDYSNLRHELTQFRDVNDNLTQARRASQDGDWAEVQVLAKVMLDAPISGELRQEIDKLATQARQELAIQRLRQQLHDKDPQFAANVLNEIKDASSDFEALSRRLQPEIEAINTATNNTPPLQPLFDEAMSLAGSSHTADRIQALRIFRYLGGDRTESRQEGWPEYKLSMLTCDAHERAIAMRQSIREDTIDNLLAAHQAARQKDPGQLNKQTGSQMADLGSGLRDARLLDNEAERTAARFFIVTQASVVAQDKEVIGNWHEAVEIWQSLDQQYPGAVDYELRRARIQQAVMQADLHLRQGATDEALGTLQAAQIEPDMAHAWQLEMKLAEVYARLADLALAKPSEPEVSYNQEAADYFRQAFNCLLVAARHGGGEEAESKQKELERERFVSEAYYKAKAIQATAPKQALIILQTALKSELAADSDRLRRLRETIYTHLSAQKLSEARQKKMTGDAKVKVEAVMALVDLREIEQIAEIDPARRQADNELAPLQSQLAPSAEAVIDDAEGFNPQYTLNDALEQARELDGRLQTFSQIQTLFDSAELERLRDRLAESQRTIGDQVSQLEDLKRLLDGANKLEHWQQAVITGDFSLLEDKRAQIEKLDLKAISEVRIFEEKLAEWRSLYVHYKQEIEAIRHDFVYKDNFRQIYQKVRQLSIRPHAVGGRPLKHITEAAFSFIHTSFGQRLLIHDLYGDVINGWTAVEQAAKERHEEMSLWEAWADKWGQPIKDLERARQLCASHDPATPPLNVKRTHWRQFKEAAEQALVAICSLPERDGVVLQPRHQTSEKLVQLARQQQAVIEEQLRQIEIDMREQDDMRQFPAIEEWARAKTVSQLEWVIHEAEAIGPSNEEERQRLKTYQYSVLPQLKAKLEKKGIFSRLLGR